MSAWVRVMWVATVLIMPGGFFIFLAYVWTRTLLRASEKIRATTPGSTIRLRDIFAKVTFRDLVREARATPSPFGRGSG